MSARTIAAWGVCAGVGGEGLANFALDSILTGQLNGTEKFVSIPFVNLIVETRPCVCQISPVRAV